jgi:membrane protease YdiL (CAAX protease family)
MIGYLVAVGVYLSFRYGEFDTVPDHVVKNRAVTDGFVLGGMHALLVLVAVLVTWRPPSITPAARAYPAFAWLAGLPVLVVMLMVNFGYGLVLRFLAEVVLGAPPQPDQTANFGLGDGWIAVLLICVQPAIVEEFFFRFLLLGHLRPHIGTHGAVWLSAFFFASAHLGQLFGFPVLFLLGAVLGYARVYSGGLILPMALHFLHNLAVITLGSFVEQVHFS